MSTESYIAYFRASTNCEACYHANSMPKGHSITTRVSDALYDREVNPAVAVVLALNQGRRDASRDRALHDLEDMAKSSIAGDTAARLCLEACQCCTYDEPRIAEAIAEFKKKSE